MTVKQGEPFFLMMGVCLLAIVLSGFGLPVLSRPGGIASMTPLMHIHGAVFVSWFIFYLLQARLIGAGNRRMHMRLGTISLSLAFAMVVLGYVITRFSYARPDFSIAGYSPAASVIFPFTDIVNFVVAYALALAHRKNPAAHKRLMLLAGILIIDPAVARLVTYLGAPAPVILVLELAFFAALFAYDIRKLRRVHWASLIGLGLYIAVLVSKFTLAKTSAWHAFVDIIFG